jgi:hypothetical protein
MIHKHLFLLPELLSRLIFTKCEKGSFWVQATLKQKPRRALPEEIVRQLFILSLIHQYGYPEDRIRLEFIVQMGITKKRTDIVILDQNNYPYIIVEAKQEFTNDTRKQLEGYVNVTRASYGVAVSADDFYCFNNNGIIQKDMPVYGGSCDLFENDNRPQNGNSYLHQFPIKIDDFERISQTHAKLTIKGCAITLSNNDLSVFKVIQKHFLSAGCVLNNIKQQDWYTKFSELMDSTPVTPTSPIESKDSDEAIVFMQGIMSVIVPIGSGLQTSIHNLILLANSMPVSGIPDAIMGATADEVLKNHGIKISGRNLLFFYEYRPFVALAKSAGSDVGLRQILRRYKDAGVTLNSSIGSTSPRAVPIPMQPFLDGYKKEINDNEEEF